MSRPSPSDEMLMHMSPDFRISTSIIPSIHSQLPTSLSFPSLCRRVSNLSPPFSGCFQRTYLLLTLILTPSLCHSLPFLSPSLDFVFLRSLFFFPAALVELCLRSHRHYIRCTISDSLAHKVHSHQLTETISVRVAERLLLR